MDGETVEREAGKCRKCDKPFPKSKFWDFVSHERECMPGIMLSWECMTRFAMCFAFLCVVLRMGQFTATEQAWKHSGEFLKIQLNRDFVAMKELQLAA